MTVDLGRTDRINLFKSSYIAAVNLYAYLIQGNSVYNFTSGTWEALSPSGTTTLGSAHRAALTWLYNDTAKVGVQVSLAAPLSAAESILAGVYSLVLYDGASYLGGLDVHINNARVTTVIV